MSSTKKYILKAYIIHEDGLKFRETNMNNTLTIIRKTCEANNITFMPTIIKNPSTEALLKDINNLQTKVKYEKINDPEFDNRMHMLSIEMISNIEKHKEAWRLIANDTSVNPISIVLEDDAFLLPDFSANLTQLLKQLPNLLLEGPRKWDLCFLGTTKQDGSSGDDIHFHDTRSVGKIIPTKESYIVTPHIIRRLINSVDTMRYTMRTHLSWFIHTNQDIRSVYANKPTFLDGSKIGICTSTIHPMNPLVINKEFMELWNLQNKKEVSIQEIRSLYKKIEHLRSPDILHIYGKLLIERGNYMDADEAFLEALKLLRAQHGIMGSSSHIINDAINNYKNIQRDPHDYRNKESKYIEPDMD